MSNRIIFAALLLFSCIVLAQDEPNQFGPTVSLVCNKPNPLNEFMYFVPLISPVEVTNQRSEDNKQVGYVTSYQRQINADSFTVSCEFKMEGQGYNINNFDKKAMIARNEKNVKNGKPIRNILDYIKFNGEGMGRIDVWGTISNKVRTVTRVEVHFNVGEAKSPVYAGLYSVEPNNGKYLYENRYGMKVARVNTLIFTKDGDVPRMDIKVDAVGTMEDEMGIMGCIIGVIANMIIQPLEISKIGNDEMLKLGLALSENKETFTFPKARNLIVK
ncbi:MAG: hypothetical protein LLF92_05990 [Planctomycetaceae bacterium]|nr:hypothetical protein [Planctomycetaceae bacterium]